MLGFTPIASAALTTTRLPLIYVQTASVVSHVTVTREPTTVGKKITLNSAPRLTGPVKAVAKTLSAHSAGSVHLRYQLAQIFTPLNPQVLLGVEPFLSPIGGGRFTRGDVLQWQVTYYDYEGNIAFPPVAGIRLSFFESSLPVVVNGTLTKLNDSYVYLWDSAPADAGNVDWFIYTSNTMRSAAQGTFTLVANKANVA